MKRDRSRLDEHVHDQRVENVLFLRSVGLCEERIAKRLGMSVDAIEKLFDRRKQRGESNPASTAGRSEATRDEPLSPLRLASTEG